MHTLWIFALLGGCAGSAVLSACADHVSDPDAPAVDPDAPRVDITQPARGTFAGDVATLAVTGTATDDVGVAQVQVNGIDATLASDGSWTATIPVQPGTQLIHVVARDAQGNAGKASRAVVTGPMQPIAAAVPRAITAAISAQAIGAIGRGIAGFLQTSDLAAIIAPHNPVIDAGGGPDCLYAQGAITRMSVGSATRVALVPRTGGLGLEVELDRVAIGLRLRYAALCVDGSRDITVRARRIKVTGVLKVGVAAGAFDTALADRDVQITGLDVDLGGVPGEVVDLLRLDTALGPIVGWATEQFVMPAVDTALASLDDTRTIDVLGTAVDIAVAPSRIAFDAAGGVIELATTLRARGDADSPGYVFVANPQPAMSTNRGFALAVADDAANQLLGSLWAAGAMDRTFDLAAGGSGELGKPFDRVELSAKVPLFVAAGDGSVELTIGDLVATFKRGDAVAAAIAVSAQVGIRVATGADGKPRLDVGTTTAYVDVLDPGAGVADALSSAQLEAIASFALVRAIELGSGAIGAVPLPALGGVAVHDLAITEQPGYLVVAGDVR